MGIKEKIKRLFKKEPVVLVHNGKEVSFRYPSAFVVSDPFYPSYTDYKIYVPTTQLKDSPEVARKKQVSSLIKANCECYIEPREEEE